MHSHVSLEVSALTEPMATDSASEWQLPRVRPYVQLKCFRLGEHFRTMKAPVQVQPRVQLPVLVQRRGPLESFTAILAAQRLPLHISQLSSVPLQVLAQVRRIRKRGTATGAGMRLRRRVDLHVSSDLLLRWECFPANVTLDNSPRQRMGLFLMPL